MLLGVESVLNLSDMYSHFIMILIEILVKNYAFFVFFVCLCFTGPFYFKLSKFLLFSYINLLIYTEVNLFCIMEKEEDIKSHTTTKILRIRQ